MRGKPDSLYPLHTQSNKTVLQPLPLAKAESSVKPYTSGAEQNLPHLTHQASQFLMVWMVGWRRHLHQGSVKDSLLALTNANFRCSLQLQFSCMAFCDLKVDRRLIARLWHPAHKLANTVPHTISVERRRTLAQPRGEAGHITSASKSAENGRQNTIVLWYLLALTFWSMLTKFIQAAPAPSNLAFALLEATSGRQIWAATDDEKTNF